MSSRRRETRTVPIFLAGRELNVTFRSRKCILEDNIKVVRRETGRDMLGEH